MYTLTTTESSPKRDPKISQQHKIEKPSSKEAQRLHGLCSANTFKARADATDNPFNNEESNGKENGHERETGCVQEVYRNSNVEIGRLTQVWSLYLV